MAAILQCEHVSKTFLPGNVQAVKGATLSFEAGTHIIMGKSGSGKSTLLHILGGLEKPTEGKVLYEGEDIYRELDMEALRREHFGFIFQAYNLIPEINVCDNILMPAYIAGKKRQARLDELVDALDIRNKLKQMPETLSGGEQQRVAIARALINSPRIIFADEPTGNLDEENKEVVMEMLAESCRKYGATLIMVTHDSDQLSYAEHSYYMKDGVIQKR
jgi:putative ABC transport system ATP-binding protein